MGDIKLLTAEELKNEIYNQMIKIVTDLVVIDITIISNIDISHEHKSYIVVDDWDPQTGKSDLIFISETGFKQLRLFNNPELRFVLNEIKNFRDYRR